MGQLIKMADIPAEVVAAAVQHARECSPRESCGVILRIGNELSYRPLTNLSAHPDRVNADPDEYIAAENAGEVLVEVHSHVWVGPQASNADRQGCELAGIPWMIVTPDGRSSWLEPCGWKPELEGREYVYGLFDCARLCRDWYDAEYGIKVAVPELPEGWWLNTDEDVMTRHLRDAGFSPAEGEPRRGDLMLFVFEGSVPHHTAIYLGNGEILHHLTDKKSRRDPYRGFWRDRTLSTWRHPCAK